MPHSNLSYLFLPCLPSRVSSLCLFVTVYVSLFLIAGIVLFSSLFHVRSERERHVSSLPRSQAEVRRSESGRYYYHLVDTGGDNRWEARLDSNESLSPVKEILSMTGSSGLRWPYSNTEINCSSLQKITELKFVASGWTKAVFKGRYRGRDVAVKTVNLNGHDIQECQKRLGATLTACHTRAAAKILKEIILLTELKHRNVIKVLGSCVPDTAPGPIAMVTELGEPLDTLTLLQYSWEDRLRMALGIAELLHHLAHSPLGSLAMNDFRRQQFVLVNGTIKLSDVDDLGINEPECRTNADCNSTRYLHVKSTEDRGVTCVDSRCRGHNERLNVWHAGQHFIRLFLPISAPASLNNLIQELLAAYRESDSDTHRVLSITRLLVHHFKTGKYITRTHLLPVTNSGFEKFPDSDMPGMFDYRCNDSISLVGCVKSVFDEMEARLMCAQDLHCFAVVLGQQKTWTVITELGSSTRSYCELAGRTQPMAADVIVALVEMGIGVDGLEAYAMRPNRTVMANPTQATQPKQLGILQAGVKQTPPAHIPPHLPPLPDPHAYIRTPTHKQPVTEYEAIREKAASQKRDLERALTRFVAKTGDTNSLFLTEDNQTFPLIACKHEVPAYLKALLPQDQVFDFEDEFGVPSVSSPRTPRRCTSVRGDDVDMEDDEEGEESKEEGKTAEVDAIDNPYLRAVKLPRNNKRSSSDGRQ